MCNGILQDLGDLWYWKDYNKHRYYILLNKNIIISGVFAFFGGTLFTQSYAQYDSNNLANSVITLLIEYGIYIPLFALLFYRDNRVRYIDPLNGSRKYGVIKTDIKKLVAAFSISELMFSFAKIYIHYELLQMSIVEAYQASMIGSISAWLYFWYL